MCGVQPLLPASPPASPLHAKHVDLITQSDQEGNESEEDESVRTKSATRRAFKRGTTGGKGAKKAASPQRVYGRPTNPLLHALFLWGTASGHELFYITVMPFLYWLLDNVISRRGVVIWVTVYYVGQYLKDLLRLPRPPSPPVLRMSTFYEAEYGMPSTHAMGAVSVVSAIVIAHYQSGFDIDLWKWVILAVLHVAVVCLSRLYMGAHSVADVVAGVVLGSVILVPFVVWGREIDYWFATSEYVPIVVFLVAIFAVLIYPKPPAWSESYGDTATIIGVASGAMVGIWAIAAPPLEVLNQLRPIELKLDLTGFVLQCAIGFVTVFFTRAVCKGTLLKILPPLLLPPKSHSHLHPTINFDNVYRNYIVEIPIKLVTYTAIGFNACFTSRFLCDQALIAWA